MVGIGECMKVLVNNYLCEMGRKVKYFKGWNEWRKRNTNGRIYKFLVLLKLTKSPTFESHRQFRKMKWGMTFESNRK